MTYHFVIPIGINNEFTDISTCQLITKHYHDIRINQI